MFTRMNGKENLTCANIDRPDMPADLIVWLNYYYEILSPQMIQQN